MSPAPDEHGLYGALARQVAGLFGLGPVIAAAVIGDVRDVSLPWPGPLRRL